LIVYQLKCIQNKLKELFSYCQIILYLPALIKERDISHSSLTYISIRILQANKCATMKKIYINISVIQMIKYHNTEKYKTRKYNFFWLILEWETKTSSHIFCVV